MLAAPCTAPSNVLNAAVTAAFIAAGQGETISAVHLLQAVQRELRKQGRLIKASEFPELDETTLAAGRRSRPDLG